MEYVNYLPKIQDEERELRTTRALVAATISASGCNAVSAVKLAFDLVDEVQKQEAMRVQTRWAAEQRRQRGY